MTDQKDLLDLNIGDKINHYLVVTKAEVKLAKNNREYLNLELRDRSVSLNAKMWDSFNEFKDKETSGRVVKVLGLLEEFMGTTQIRIEKIRFATEKENINPEDFLPKSQRDLQVMIEELNSRIKELKDDYLKELIKQMLTGENFDKFIKVPAGKSWHHSYIHGLLEHTLEIIKICDLMCNIHSELNRDLLITGAILHDYGKIEELTAGISFDYTDKGKLLGHIVIASNQIEKAIDNIKNFPEELKIQLLHLILSHQGKLEHASPVEPKTLEAIALYHADELSAKVNAYKLAIRAEENKEDNWTKFLPLANTSLYTKRIIEEGKLKDTLF